MQTTTPSYVDYQHIAPEHAAIHERLQNWRRWVSGKGASWTAHPMWRHLKEKEERERGTITLAVDAIDGQAICRDFHFLPHHRRSWSSVKNRSSSVEDGSMILP